MDLASETASAAERVSPRLPENLDQVEADIQGLGGMGDSTDCDAVDSGLGDGSRRRQVDPSRSLQDGLSALDPALDPARDLDRLAKTLETEVIQKNHVELGLQRIPELGQQIDFRGSRGQTRMALT